MQDALATSEQEQAQAEPADSQPTEDSPAAQFKTLTVAEGTLIVSPGRDPRLPPLFRVESHPKVPKDGQGGRTFVALVDTSEEGMLASHEFLNGMEFPEGTDEGIRDAGFLVFGPGDRLFLRSMQGDGRPEDDQLEMLVLGQESIPRASRNAWRNVKKHVGGPRAKRTPQKARQDENGLWEGGVPWEHSNHAVNVSTSERCYTVAQSYQMPPAPLAVAAVEAGDPALAFAMKRQAYATNLPPIGHESNYVSPTMQLNISPTQSADSLALGNFKKDLGSFGGKHKDEHDSSGGMTTMITFSDLHPSEHPGFFIVGDFGVAIRTLHCAVVSFGALPGGKFFYMPPELIDPRHDNKPIETNIANWIHSGLYLTSPAGFLQYYYRALCQIAYHFNRQVPDKHRLQIDFNKLAECMSIEDSDGNIRHAEPWEFHPGSQTVSTEFGCARADCPRLWDEHKVKREASIPHCVYLNKQRQSTSFSPGASMMRHSS
ncbi:hypothetical protein L226DRAFT_474651 [Lentinus tigrinus ALCF2SS1-7]|uniref:uncharacterized protein n=1 Tax=Lentinus tigrinus ALCF2SS1-7 TaxID=1328758 RepID=UPI0011662DBD|nr:hypothetical protein L226DRAFT_474651 [Lentinus tigrinus ALCF2SS1-7]